MSPGDGEVEVSPIGVKCLDNSEVEVDLSLCGIGDDFDLASAKKEIQKSPAGDILVNVANSDNGSVTIQIGEGETFGSLPNEEKVAKLKDHVTCSPTYEFSYKATCEIPALSYDYGAYPENNMTSCDGERIVTRSYTCLSNITGEETDLSDCAHLTLENSIIQFSPEGSSTLTLSNGDVSLVNCQVGKTSNDIGNGSTIISSVSCGPDRMMHEGVCVIGGYLASAFSYPSNELEVGEGELTVNATGITLCNRIFDNASVEVSLCEMPDPAPTQIHRSPAGEKIVPQENGDVYSYSLAEGELFIPGSSTMTVVSCGGERTLIGNACVTETFEITEYHFPDFQTTLYSTVSGMTASQIPEDGILRAQATGIKECRGVNSGVVMDNSYCTPPETLPEMEIGIFFSMNIEDAPEVETSVVVNSPSFSGTLTFSPTEQVGAFPIDVTTLSFYKVSNTCKVSRVYHLPSTLTNFSAMFRKCEYLVQVPPVVELKGSLFNMFNGAIRFNQDLLGWDTSNVTSMSSMFNGATAFNGDISNWDTSNVTLMNSMFRDTSAFNQDLSSWNVSNVENMNQMFFNATAFNSSLTNWDAQKVTDMGSMFRGATAFNSDVSGWDTTSVLNMSEMFRDASLFNQDLSSWDTSSVTGMTSMFYGAVAFNGDISNWDTSNVLHVGEMFREAHAFNRDISGWDVSKFISIHGMFYNANSFNQNLSSWSLTKPITSNNYDYGTVNWVLPKPSVN